MNLFKRTRSRLFVILEPASSGDYISRTFDFFLMVLIILNVFAVMLETVDSFYAKYGQVLKVFEVFSVSVFTIEYLLRVWVCTENPRFSHPVRGRIKFIFTPFGIVDLVAILPFYIPTVFPMDLRFMRAVRLFRIFRIFKVGRYYRAWELLVDVLRDKKEELLVTVFAIVIGLVIVSSLMYFAEHDAQPEVFSSIPASLWWAVITLTTVGYGDIYPVTFWGKLLAGVVSILGIGLFALPAGILASGFSERLQQRRSRGVCPICGKKL